jgi:hypothetical protein
MATSAGSSKRCVGISLKQAKWVRSLRHDNFQIGNLEILNIVFIVSLCYKMIETDRIWRPVRILKGSSRETGSSEWGRPFNVYAFWLKRVSDEVKRVIAPNKRIHTKG